MFSHFLYKSSKLTIYSPFAVMLNYFFIYCGFLLQMNTIGVTIMVLEGLSVRQTVAFNLQRKAENCECCVLYMPTSALSL